MKTDETPFYLGSQLLTKKLLCFRLFVGTAILVAFSCGLPAQPSAGGNSSYQTRSEAALNRRQLAGLTQDVAAMRELVDKLQFELQALQRTNQELRQRLAQVQQAQAVPPPQAGLGTAEMEKILSGMRSKFYQDMDKLEKKFFTSLEDMQKQMNRALNDVASAPTNAAPPSSPPSSGNSSTSLDYSEFYEHVVVSGDTLYGIHRQYKQYNVRLEDIFAANDLNKNSKLKVGQKLILPIRK